MKIEDKELKITINGEEQDAMNFLYEDFLKAGEYIYKENDKWYIHKLKYGTFEKQIEEKKIPEKINDINSDFYVNDCYYERLSKEEIALDLVSLKNWINSIIDYLKSKGE